MAFAKAQEQFSFRELAYGTPVLASSRTDAVQKGNGYLDSVKVATTRVRPMKMQCTAAPRDRLWRSKDTSGHAHVLVLLLGKTTIGQIFLVLRRAEITSVIANSRTRIDRCVDGWVYPSSAFSSQCAIFTFQPSLDEMVCCSRAAASGSP